MMSSIFYDCEKLHWHEPFFLTAYSVPAEKKGGGGDKLMKV